MSAAIRKYPVAAASVSPVAQIYGADLYPLSVATIPPDTAAEKPDQGEVKAIGKGKVLEDGKVRALDLKVGDRVLFGKYSGQTVKVEGEELLVMREEDIMGVIE